jgi:hypothetical protein
MNAPVKIGPAYGTRLEKPLSKPERQESTERRSAPASRTVRVALTKQMKRIPPR